MRRKDREIKDINGILAIIKKCDVCSVAFFDEMYPYIVPLNFGVVMKEEQFQLFFHGADAGKKMELLKRNNHVAFEMNCSHKLLLEEKSCDCTMEYESVCGNGVMEILEEDEKINALTALMNQYAKGKKHEFDPNEVKAIAVLRLKVDKITAKRLKRN